MVRTDGRNGALRARIEFADTFDRVAEQLDPDRARRFGRENIHDAAANGELPGQFNHLRAGIACAAEMSDQLFVRELCILRQSFRQGQIYVGILVAPERSRDRRDHERNFAVRETIECCGAALENIGVRSLRVPGKAVEGGKDGDAPGVPGKICEKKRRDSASASARRLDSVMKKAGRRSSCVEIGSYEGFGDVLKARKAD